MKYLFAVFNLVAVACIGWVLTELPGAAGATSPTPVGTDGGARIAPVTEKQRARVARLGRALDTVETALSASSGKAAQALIAPAPRPEPEPASTAVARTAALPERNLRLVLDAETPMAVIDGELVGAGDTLPNGGRVEAIDGARVVVREADGRRQRLTVPAARLGVGTLRRNPPAAHVN